jgi:hypothetical protein
MKRAIHRCINWNACLGVFPASAGGKSIGQSAELLRPFESASETTESDPKLKEILPDLSRAAVLGAAGAPNFAFAMVSLRNAAQLLNVSAELSVVPVTI